MNRYNVTTFMPVTKGGIEKRYELAFGSGSEKSTDTMRAGNCNSLGMLLETRPELFTDESGEQLKSGQLYNEGYIGVGGNVVTCVSRIGSGNTEAAFITLPDGTQVPLGAPSGATSNGGRLPE